MNNERKTAAVAAPLNLKSRVDVETISADEHYIFREMGAFGK
jgi:hypothetical protein